MSEKLSWDEEFSARFKPLRDRDVEIWQEIILNEISHLKDGEVLAAVRSLGIEKRNGRIKYLPTVENIISAIIKNRWIERVSRDTEGPKNIGCVFCGDTGWIAYGASAKKHETFEDETVITFGAHHHAADGWGFLDCAVPCLCSLGAKALQVYPQLARETIIKLTHDVVDWKKTITADSCFDDRRFAVDEG